MIVAVAEVIDLDEYRRRRVAEGTWPPDEATVRDYWISRRRRPLPSPPDSRRPPPKSA